MDGSSNFNFWGGGGNVTLQLANDAEGIGRAGQKVNLVLTPADVQTPAELDSYLAGFRNFEYRADEASKPILVDRDNDYYRTFGSNNAFRRANVKSSLNASIPEITPESSTTQYAVVDRMIGGFVPDVTADNAERHYNVQMVVSELCKNVIMLDREYDVWTMLTTLTNWDTTVRTTLGATAAWDTSTGPGSASNPLRDIRDRVIASKQKVTDIWFNQRVAFGFLEHPEVREQMRAVIGDAGYKTIAGAVQVAQTDATIDFQIPGYPTFHVSCAKVLDETTDAVDYVMDNDCVLLTVPPGVPKSGFEIATTHTFRRKGRSGTGFQTRQFRIENRGAGGVMFVVNMADIAVMTGNTCGGLIKDCYQ